LCFRSEALAAIFRCTSEMGKTTAVEELSYRLLADLLQIVGADWFILRLVPKDEPSLLVFTKCSRPGLTLDPIWLDRSRGMSANSIKETTRSRQQVMGSAALDQCAELQAAISRKDVFFDPQHPLAADDPLAEKLPRSVGLVQPITRSETLLG